MMLLVVIKKTAESFLLIKERSVKKVVCFVRGGRGGEIEKILPTDRAVPALF